MLPLRLSFSDIIGVNAYEYIKAKTGHDLSKTAFFKIKKQLKSEGRDWVLRLRDDHDEFLYEYRQRYEELFAYQKELWDIVIANKQSNPMVSIRAIDSLHGITNDIARIIDLAPYVAGSDSVEVHTIFINTISKCLRDSCIKPIKATILSMAYKVTSRTIRISWER